MYSYIAGKVLHHIMSAVSQDLIVYLDIVEELCLMCRESFYDFVTSCLDQKTNDRSAVPVEEYLLMFLRETKCY